MVAGCCILKTSLWDVVKAPCSAQVEDVCFFKLPFFPNRIKIVKLCACITKYSNPITWDYFTCEETYTKLAQNHTLSNECDLDLNVCIIWKS